MRLATRLATVRAGAQRLWGGVEEDGFVDLSGRFPQWTGLRQVIAAGALAQVAKAAEGLAATHPFGSFTWEIPVTDPGKILCVGVNFPDRNAEYRDGQEAPSHPSLFVRFAQSFVGHEAALLRPRESEQLDYEGEIAVVIGPGGRRIAEAEALGHVAALTLCNEGTIRDWVRHGKFNVTQGKTWDRSGAMGPWLVPFAGAGQILDIGLQTRVNGEARQSDRTGRMIFSVPRLIAYVSTFLTLEAGDIIVTGTPAGAGARRDPPQWLRPGDVVEVEAEGIGILRNGVRDE